MLYSKKESTHSKVDAPEWLKCSHREPASLVDQTREAFLFMLTFSLSEKVQQRYNKRTEPDQSIDHTQHNHKRFKDCHTRHLPSYVFQLSLVNRLGRLPLRSGRCLTCATGTQQPVMGYFPCAISRTHID